MANKLWDTIKQGASKLFGTNKKNEQNSAGTTQTSAAATSAAPANNTPQYRDNSVVQVSEPGRSGIYQYNSTERLSDQNAINEQAAFARQLGYTRDQTIELLRNGTRWKNVALGQNNRPIVSYQGGRYTSQQEIDEQSAIARSLGMSRDEVVRAMRQGIHWMEEPEKPNELWEDSAYLSRAENRGFLYDAANLVPSALAEGFANASQNPEDTFIEFLKYSAGYSDKKIEDMRKTGEFDQLLQGYLSRYSTQEDNTFSGRFQANYTLGDLQQRANIMLGQGVMYGDQNLIEEAYKLLEQADEYQRLNEEALNGGSNAPGLLGTVSDWLSRDIAQYLPQRYYQTIASLPAQPLALVGGKFGEAAAQAFGSGSLMYSTTLGASYANLTSRGVDPVDAANMAKDEAFLSSIVESSDEFYDWYKGVASGLNLFGGEVTEEVVEKFGKRFAKGVKKWLVNAGQEGGQEIIQEMISMANELRYQEGNTSGGSAELIKYFLRVCGDRAPELLAAFKREGVTEELERLWEAGRGGAVVGLVMGGGSQAVGGVRNNLQIASSNRYFDNLVLATSADPNALIQISDGDINKLLKAARHLDRSDAVEILEGEVLRRGEAQNQNAASTRTATEESSEFEQLRDIAADNIENLTDEQLQRYNTLLQQEIKANEDFGSEENKAIADMYRDDLQDAIAEGVRRQNAVEQAPSEEYNEVTTMEGEQANGSNQGDTGNSGGVRPQQASLGEEGDLQHAGISGAMQENAKARRLVTQTEEGGNRGISEEGVSSAASQPVSGRNDIGTGAVQRAVSQERAGRVSKIFASVEKHFNLKSFIKDPVRHYGNIRKFAIFSAKTLRTVFGSQQNASRFVRSWMSDPVNSLSLELASQSFAGKNSKLSNLQQLSAMQALAASQIMQDFYEGVYSAQDIADIGEFDLETAQKILDGAVDTMNRFMADERILNKDGSLKTNPLRRASMEANRRSGEGKPISNISSGERVGTAETLDLTEKYVAQKNDKEIKTNNKYGNKIYQRGDSYLIVNQNGFVVEEANEGDDVQDAMRHAHAIANKASPSYNIASVRLFDKDMYFNNGDGIFMNQENVFAKENMTSVQGSLASDLMNTAYSDIEKGSRKGTTNWFKLNLSVDSNDRIGSLTNATKVIRDIIQQSMTIDADGKRGIKMANGKRYVFFGMTANGAKKGEAIMVDYEYYEKLRTASLSGKKESEVEKFNPAKYLTASASIFSPSNNDLGIKIVEKDPKTGKQVRRVAVIGDLYTVRPDTLRQFMRVDNEVDAEALTKAFTDTMTRKLKEQGKSDAQIKAEVEKADIPSQVKYIIEHNDVGTIINIMADVMFQATDGTGLIDIPEGSPYEGQSVQMRSLGGFKAQLVGMHFSDYLHAVIPFNPNAEYLYRGEEGEITGGFRYQDKDVGVEVLSYWGDEWIPVKDLRAILFNSTVKFAGQFESTAEFYEKTGDADLRSIPRENVYGANVSDSSLEGYQTRGLGQLLRSQFNFTDDEVMSVLGPRLDDIQRSLMTEPRLAAKLFGVDFDGPAPARSDSKAYAIWQHGPEFFTTRDGKRWLADKMGNIVEDMRKGQFAFKNGEASFGWIDPDTVGLIHAMTAITRINNELVPTEGGGFGLNGFAGLTPGQIFNANLDNANNDNRTVVGRFPSTKAIDVQIRENVNANDPNYKEMVERFGLDKGNTYIAINDTLSMYLDNDYDGDPIITFQGALADLFDKIRSRDTLDENGKPQKKNVLVATAKGLQSQEMEIASAPPVEFSHAKADKVQLGADAILTAVRRYLEVNDSTAKNHKGPRTVGIYDNMVERLAALPDSALKQPAQEAGMSVKEYRALMEARFGVAYVLSIDYAKTGREFSEFFSMIDQLDAMLYDIAEANNLISAREIDKDTGAKITKNDSFVPSWWKNGSGSKREKFKTASEAGNVVSNPNTLLSAMDRLLPTKTNRDGGTSGWTSWFDTFKQKLGYGSGKRLNWSGGMTVTPDAYSNLSPEFYAKLSKAYLEVTSSENPEFIALKKRYQEAHRDVKDADIKNYLIYKHFQQNLGLTNEQFTDLMMMMLSNSNVSSGTILSLDQSKADKNNKQMPTTDIYKRNVRLTKTFEQATRSLVDIDNRINTVGKALIKARESISKMFDSEKMVLNAVDAAHVKRIADMQNHLEAGNNSLRQNFNELFKTLRGVQSGARELSADDLDTYRSAYEAMREEIAGLRNQLNSSESVFASGIAADVNLVFSEVDKEVRNALRQINTLERSLNELYNAYERQISKAAEAVNETSGVFTDSTTGLEGLTEDEILSKIGGAANDSRRTAQENRMGTSERRTRAQKTDNGISDNDQGRQPSVNVQGANEQSEGVRRTAQEGRVEGLHRGLTERPSGVVEAINDEDGKLSIDFGNSDTSPTTITAADSDGTTSTFTIRNSGHILLEDELSDIQKRTRDLLEQYGIKALFLSDGMDEHDASGRFIGRCGGLTPSGKTVDGYRYVLLASEESSRHEPVHVFLDAMPGTKADKAYFLLGLCNDLINDKNIELDYNKFQACMNEIGRVYETNDLYDKLHEFFAMLFSGDNFYGVDNSMAIDFMEKMAVKFGAGNSTYIDAFLDKCLPDLSDADHRVLSTFYFDPFINREVRTYAQKTAEAEDIKPLPFGANRKNIARSSTKIQTAIQKAMASLSLSENVAAKKAAADLKNFNTTVKMLLKGKATSEELYVAYNKLKDTLFHDEAVDAYFDDFIDINRFVNEDAYNEAVDHALAKFAAHANQVLQAEDNNAKLTKQSVKHKTDGKLTGFANLMGSWQLNAPTVLKSLMGFKKGTLGYKLASRIETANKNMQRNYWEAYRHIQNVAKLTGFREMMEGKPNPKLHLSSQITGTPTSISTIEAINLLRMLKSVRYTQGDLHNVKGFSLKDGTRIRTAIGAGKTRVETIGKLYNELEYYFEHEATTVEKAYYKAIDSVFEYFTPEVQRVGKALNGFIESIPADQYSPISWGHGSIEENFDPREAQLKADPRYMKARVEEAGGYLYAAPMNDVMETYIRRMSDYLAFGELREQMRIMNRATDKRGTKTLGQITGENMGEHYARFVNNYVRDLIHYNENSDSFWYKARMLMQRGTLVGNPSVMMKQSASYLNAASVIDMKYLMRALGSNKFNGDYANGKSGLLEYRRITGNFDPTITDIFGQKASKNPLVRLFQNGISIIDHATVKRLYVAACLQVEAEGISRNSPQFDEAVENLFSDAVIQTQPQFDPSLRPENSRTKNEGVRMLSMFRTQQSQNFNKLVTAIGEYQADKNADTRAIKMATITGLVGSSLALALFTSLSDAILHRKKKYKDEEGEITPESIANRIAINASEALAGTAWFGDDLAKFLIDRLDVSDTQEFYGLSMGPVSTIYDAVGALGDMLDAYKDGKNMISASKKFVGYVTQAFGIPLNNAYNYVNAVTMYYLDHMGENPDDYDDWAKWMDNNLKAQNQLIKAAEAGNEKKTNRMWEQLQKRYSKPSSELNEQLHKDYSRGNVSADTAVNLLITYGGLDDEESAKKRVAKWDFDREHPEFDDLTESNVWRWINDIEPTGVSLQTFYDAVMHFKQLSADKDNGKDNYAMLIYLNSLNLTDTQRSAMWSSFGSNFYSAYDPTTGVYARFESYAKPAGISAADFTTYYDTFNNISADKKPDGKTISGSKQKKVIAYINTLPLTKEQKRALWRSFGYTSKPPW